MTNPEVVNVLETTTGPDTMTSIQEALDHVWSTHQVSDLVRMHMDLAVSEIAANIIEHSGDGQPVRLRMEVRLTPAVVETRFTDDGHPATVDLMALNMPDALAERGRGLAIAYRVLDELTYRRDDAGNHWILVRRRAN